MRPGLLRKFIERLLAGLRVRRDEIDMAEVRLIVGLGNPGKEYEGTRHNVGFEIIDKLASRLCTDVKKKKFGALYGETVFDDKKIILFKPQDYMNRSGQNVATVAGFYRLPIENILVVTDDMALEPGSIRLRSKGSAGGHNGLSDIIRKIGTNEFARLRVGIGQSGRSETVGFVLGKPSAEDKKLISQAMEKASMAVLSWVSDGIDNAMNKFNVKNNG